MKNLRKNLSLILIFAVFLRLFTMLIFPLTDTTEARYGEIARKMLETNNWITPQHAYGVPFWAKPPLSTWCSAISMKIFGVNEFAARLPSLFFMLGITWLTWYLSNTRYRKDFALLSIVILFTFPMFFITAGAVMTDASLAFCVTLAFTAFWLGINENFKKMQNLYGYLFFLALGLGMLAKGPICLVLIIPPILIWQFLQKDWQRFWSFLPLVKGTILMLIIFTPWYIVAEHRTPGFLNYFIIGEHFNRFLIPGWTGDQYGYAHKQPFGMIWGFMFISIFPWSLVIIYWLWKKCNLKTLFKQNEDKDGWAIYLFCWVIWPLVFFSMARNIIITYVITMLPPLALLIIEIWSKDKSSASNNKWLSMSLLIPILTISGVMIVTAYNLNLSTSNTQKLVAQKYFELRSSDQSQLYYYPKRIYSAEFYTDGLAKNTRDIKEIRNLINNDTKDFIVIKEGKSLPKEVAKYFMPIGTFSGYILLEEI